MQFTKITKKGLTPIGLLGEILVVLAVIVILLAIVIVPRFFQQGKVVGGQIGGIQGDADKDSIRNFFDQCPCTFGDVIYDGCPATFNEKQKQEDVKKYNSEPPCGITGEIRIGTTTVEHVSGEKSEEQKTGQKSEQAKFKTYQSIEIFGDDDNDPDLPQDGTIRLACTGFVGGTSAVDCHSESNNCDEKFNLQPLKDGCWIMASERDRWPDINDCGQAKVVDGRIIPLQGYLPLKVDLVKGYQSKPNEDDPKNLFQWAWKSKPEYGSLLCNQGFWYGCRETNEGRTLDVAGKTYKCMNNEWVK